MAETPTPTTEAAATDPVSIISTPPTSGGNPPLTAPTGSATTAAPAEPVPEIIPGADSVIGPETTPAPGSDTVPGNETSPGADSIAPLTADSYTFDFPDTVTVDDTLMSEVKTIAAENNLAPEALGKVMALLPKALEAQAAAVQKANLDAFNNTQTTWRKEVEALPEFQGTRKDSSLAMIGRALDQFGNDEVRRVLTATGAGNNPAVVQFVLKMAQALGEGQPTPPGRPPGSGGRKSYAEKAYPNQAN